MEMATMSKKYEKGYEPLSSANIRDMTINMSDHDKSLFLEEMNAAIERLLESDRVCILVHENGDFTYELTEKGILWAKKAINWK